MEHLLHLMPAELWSQLAELALGGDMRRCYRTSQCGDGHLGHD